MKKRLLVLSLMGIMVFSLAGCKNSENDQNISTSNSSTQITASNESATKSSDLNTKASNEESSDSSSTNTSSEKADMEEETAPNIDISGCDTFTQIVDKKLTDGMGYANANIDGTDVLLVSSGTYDNQDGNFASIDSTIFMYKDSVIVEVGKVCSGGTAYPLSIKDGKLYTGGNHFVCKYSLTDDKLMIMEKVSVEYDKDGNETYHYESDDGSKKDSVSSEDAEKIYNSLLDEMENAEVIGYSTVKK